MTRRTRSVRLGKRFIAVAGASALAAGLAGGVGASVASAKAKPFCTSGPLTVTVFNFSEVPFKAAAAGFKKYCPSVHITFAVQTTDNLYPVALQTEKLAGKLTDIVETYDSLSPTLETDGLVQPLNKYLNKKDFYPANYWLKGMSQSYIPPKGALPQKFVGEQFFVPIEADATVFYYNVADLTKAGFTVNPTGTTSVSASGGTISDSWTWQQAETVWSALTKGSTYGVCERPDWQAEWNPLIKVEGATALGEASANVSGSAALNAFQLLLTPEQNGSDVSFATLTKNGDQCDPSFESGQAAMSVGVRGDLPGIIGSQVDPTGSPTDIGVLPIPEVNGVHPTGGGSVAWGVSTQAHHLKAALDFLHYFYSPAGYAGAEATGGIVPAVASIAADPTAPWTKFAGNPVNNAAYSISAASVQAIAPQTQGTVFNDLQATFLINMINSVLSGTSLQSALNTMQTAVNSDYASAKSGLG
jgi:ABC-type glycerol-3-phosphate transport system substrate-binding protein